MCYFGLQGSLRNIVLLVAFYCLVPNESWCDIYRFVTIDGIETFTDAPTSKNATIVIREHKKKSAKSHKNSKPEKTRDISLNEIAENTIKASLKINEPTTHTTFDPKLPPVGGRITSGVGMRIDPIDGIWRHHNGIDIAIPEGTPVRPAAPGVVVYSGFRSGYGHTILIEHDNGMITLYGHNSRLLVSQGHQVDADNVIALSGNSGRSTGPHLHFEAWQKGVNTTPAFMPGNGMPPQKIQLVSHGKTNHFRKTILDDGTILFTNIPVSTP